MPMHESTKARPANMPNKKSLGLVRCVGKLRDAKCPLMRAHQALTVSQPANAMPRTLYGLASGPVCQVRHLSTERRNPDKQLALWRFRPEAPGRVQDPSAPACRQCCSALRHDGPEFSEIPQPLLCLGAKPDRLGLVDRPDTLGRRYPIHKARQFEEVRPLY